MKQEMFVLSVFLLVAVALTACGGAATPVADDSGRPETVIQDFESYATMEFVFNKISNKISNEAESYWKATYFFSPSFESDEEIGNLKPGFLGTLIFYSETIEIEAHISGSGQYCEYNGIEQADGQQFFSILYVTTTQNSDFLGFCKEKAPKEIEGYVLILGENNTVTAKRQMLPLKTVFESLK